MQSYEKLIEGYKKFRNQYLSQENDAWRNSAKKGQDPKVMVIACSDSRVNPLVITDSDLGEIFQVHNVANLVPPYKKGHKTHHSTGAAIEFAVIHLKVEHIIIMGHSGCGGIRALIAAHDAPEETPDSDQPYSFIGPWMQIADKAANFSAQEQKLDIEAKATLCEKRSARLSRDNLLTHPWVQDAVDDNRLKLHAWHYDIGSGTLEEFSDKTGTFEELV